MVPMATNCPAYSSVPVSVSFTISSFGWAYFLGKPQISRPAAIGGSSSRYHLRNEIDVIALKATGNDNARLGFKRLGQIRGKGLGIRLVGDDHIFAIDEA